MSNFMSDCINFWLRTGKGFASMAVYDQGALESLRTLSSFAIALLGRWLGRLAHWLTPVLSQKRVVMSLHIAV